MWIGLYSYPPAEKKVCIDNIKKEPLEESGGSYLLTH